MHLRINSGSVLSAFNTCRGPSPSAKFGVVFRHQNWGRFPYPWFRDSDITRPTSHLRKLHTDVPSSCELCANATKIDQNTFCACRTMARTPGKATQAPSIETRSHSSTSLVIESGRESADISLSLPLHPQLDADQLLSCATCIA